MPVNPYESPHEPAHVAIPRTAQRTMFLLGLLSVPAGAIAGSVTCNGIGMLFSGERAADISFLFFFAGLVATLAIVIGALVYRRTRDTPVPDRHLPWLLVWTLSSQFLAAPLGMVVTFTMFAIVYSWHEGRWEIPNYLMWPAACFIFFICAATAYWVWMGRERAWDKSATPNQNEKTP